MKKLLKFPALVGLSVLLGAASAEAQVKFKVERVASLDQYVVSLTPEKTLNDRLAIIGTAQVTVRVKSDDNFSLAGVESLIKDVEWDKGTVLRRPDGATGYDYISFGLKSFGARGVKFEEGKEVALFAFKNASATPVDVSLIENNADLLTKYEKNQFNVTNHISVLGYGQKNAYTGNLLASKSAEKLIIQNMYPNPAAEKTTVSWVNLLDEANSEVYLTIVDAASGKEVLREKSSARAGEFQTSLKVDGLHEGTYLVFLEKDGNRIGKPQKLSVLK